MDKTSFNKLLNTVSNYKLSWKEICILQKEYDINLMRGLVDAISDPVQLTKVILVMLRDSAPDLTEEIIEEHMSMDKLEKVLEVINKLYLKHFNTSKTKKDAK